MSGTAASDLPRPPRRPRLLACDLDGTLLDEHGAVMAGLPEALTQLDDAGVPLVVCTGRPLAAARRLIAAARLRPLLVASYHGALVTDERDWRLVRRLTIPWRCLEETADVLSAGGLELTFYVGRDVMPGDTARTLPDGDRDPVARILAIGSVHAVDAVLERLATVAHPAVRIDRPVPFRLDIRHRLATKEEGLRVIVTELEMAVADVAAAGDDRSDAGMLQSAGWSIAVGDADSPLADVADVVVGQGELAGYVGSLAAS
jgi:hydroxymethylpyrimidine pyrophosphatase-like HAD family hydrolase